MTKKLAVDTVVNDDYLQAQADDGVCGWSDVNWKLGSAVVSGDVDSFRAGETRNEGREGQTIVFFKGVNDG